MPRELIHWWVLERSIEQVSQGGVLIAHMQKFPHAAKLGAVLHDAPYFLGFGKHAFSTVAEQLHGTAGEDTFAPLCALAQALESVDAQSQAPLRAVLGGMLTHVAADVVFHPMIYYLTGNYYDQDPAAARLARQRHRALEVHLDNEVREHFDRPAALIANVLKHMEKVALADLSAWLGTALPCPASSVPAVKLWRRAVREMSIAQRLFLSDSAGLFAHSIKGGAWAEFEALFLWGRKERSALLSGVIHYLNPVSGEAYERSVAQLLDESVALSRQYLRLFEQALKQGSLQEIAQMPGPSLNFGIVGCTPKQSKFYARGNP